MKKYRQRNGRGNSADTSQRNVEDENKNSSRIPLVCDKGEGENINSSGGGGGGDGGGGGGDGYERSRAFPPPVTLQTNVKRAAFAVAIKNLPWRGAVKRVAQSPHTPPGNSIKSEVS